MCEAYRLDIFLTENHSSLETLLRQNSKDQKLQNDLEQVTESLENDTKTFEDLEFQYLEEETEWLAYREELHHDLKMLTKLINEKQKHILSLENQGIDNHATACMDTKNIEKNLWSLLNDLEKSREELKEIDKQIFDISGQQNTQSSDEEFDVPKRNGVDIMSQSMFGSAEILSAKPKDMDVMSKSMNEDHFFNSIEMPSIKVSAFSSTPKRNQINAIDASEAVTKISQAGHDQLRMAEEADAGAETNGESDPMTKLKYNLSPPFDHKSNGTDEASRTANLNLSIESDDFEVNPLEKRVPSQDDIDRICKVTLDAPISTQGASYKVIESIKEIERNRQLLLAQQGMIEIFDYFVCDNIRNR